jgi:hypothetical protein
MAAIPITTPSTRSKRSSRIRCHRISNHTSNIHCIGSTAYGVNQCPAKVVHRPVAWVAAMKTCARPSHPSSRAISPARTTAPAVAKSAGNLNAIGEPGARASASAATAGVSGSWSAEPQSRWYRPMASMYTSSNQ